MLPINVVASQREKQFVQMNKCYLNTMTTQNCGACTLGVQEVYSQDGDLIGSQTFLHQCYAGDILFNSDQPLVIQDHSLVIA